MKFAASKPSPVPPLAARLAALSLAAWCVLAAGRPATALTPVSPGGSGSYASSVPAALQNVDGYYGLTAGEVTGSGSLFDLTKVDPSLAGQPLQTNRWWSDLVAGNRSGQYQDASGTFLHHLSQGAIGDNLSGLYGGQLWAYPGMLVPRAGGFDQYYPIAWKNDPTSAAVDPGPALQMRSDRGYTVPPDDVLVADFETGLPSEWTITPVAGFTKVFAAPSRSTWPHKVSGTIGTGWVDTQNGSATQSGNDYAGVLAGKFTVQKHYLNFLLGGGKDTTYTTLYADLKDASGNVLYAATGAQNTTLSWVTWDLSPYAGQTLTFELVDKSSASYGFLACDEIVQSDSNNPAVRYGTDLIAPKSIVTGWGDWSVSFRLADDSGLAINVTSARGIPFTWSTWEGGLKPKIMGLSGLALVNENGAAIDTSGGTFTATAFAFNYQGRAFGVFLPDNTRIVVNADGSVEPQLAGANNFLVVGLLPATSNLADFETLAYARPTDTRLSWNYTPASGTVTTNWTVSTTPLKGSNLNTLQGWLPHHYHTTTGSLNFGPYSYLTATGPMKCAVGTNWTINFPFHGIAPVLPAPVSTGAANDFQPARMQQYFAGCNPGALIGGDTYNAGKSLGVASQVMSEAAQFGDTTDFNRYKTALETSLADWMTYSPGEESKTGGAFGFFARYDDWHALVGFNPSYGTQTFNDLHFHYGYYIRTLGLLGMYDPQWVANYAPMARAIVKSYNNYDRTDTSEPFFRMFDVWEGHCNAGGLSGSTGENQESSSEAVQSWTGIFLLGSVLNDPQMRDAGAMGFAMETASTNEYWQDIYATNRPSTYTKGIAGQVWGGHTSFNTFFSADPAWVYGIQYVPSSHYLGYLTRYQTTQQLQNTWNTMWNEREAWANSFPAWDSTQAYKQYQWVTYNSSIYGATANVAAGGTSPDQDTKNWSKQADFGRKEPDIVDNGLSPYLLSYQALFDPETAVAEFDKYYAAKESVTTGGTAVTDYYLLHAIRQVGPQDDNSYTSIPTSAVYRNAATGKYSYIVYNPSTTQQNATVYTNGKAVGTFPVPAQTTINSHLDETITNLVLTPATATAVVPVGQTLQFNLVGYDQYGATYPLTNVTWTASAGGTVDGNGLFTAQANAYPVVITASTGGLSRNYTFRVGPAPVLSVLTITPGFTRVITGATQQYNAAGTDQYGNAYALGGVTWSLSGGTGLINSSTGLYSASTVGTGYLTAASGGLSTSVLVAAHAPLANIALNCNASGSTTVGTNVAKNVTDGKATTRWESTHGLDNQSIYVDLGKVYDLASVGITWENAYAKTFDVEVATDLNQTSPWTPVTATLTKTSAATDNISLTGATGRYLKLGLFTRPANSTNGFSIYEIQVYGFLTAAGITPAGVQINPGSVTVPTGQTVQFQACAFDANADGGPVSTAATWVLGGGTGGNTLSSAGLFTAGAAGGPFTVTGTVGSLSGNATVTVVSGQAAAYSFSVWQNQYFTAAELQNTAVSGPNAAPAGDGIANLLKYALNLNPKTSGAAGLPKVSVTTAGGNNYLTLTWTKVTAATDIVYLAEVSGDLQTWSSGANATTAVSTTENGDGKTQTVVVRDLTATTASAKRFVRLRITAP